MRATIELIEIQRDTLVEVIQWLDRKGHSNTAIRELVDHALNGSTMDSIRRNSNAAIEEAINEKN